MDYDPVADALHHAVNVSLIVRCVVPRDFLFWSKADPLFHHCACSL